MSTRIATSQGSHKESYALGKILAQHAQKKLGPERSPNVAIVFASSHQQYEKLMKGILEESPNVPLIGCSTAGEFTEEGLSTDGAVCAFIHSDTHCFSLGIGHNVKHDPTKALKQAINQVDTTSRSEYPHRIALIFVDGLAGCGDELVSVAVQALDAEVKVAGGAAGDNLAFQETYILYNGQAYTIVSGSA